MYVYPMDPKMHSEAVFGSIGTIADPMTRPLTTQHPQIAACLSYNGS